MAYSLTNINFISQNSMFNDYFQYNIDVSMHSVLRSKKSTLLVHKEAHNYLCVNVSILNYLSFFLIKTIGVLDLIALAPTKEVGLICTVWLDGSARNSKI